MPFSSGPTYCRRPSPEIPRSTRGILLGTRRAVGPGSHRPRHENSPQGHPAFRAARPDPGGRAGRCFTGGAGPVKCPGACWARRVCRAPQNGCHNARCRRAARRGESFVTSWPKYRSFLSHAWQVSQGRGDAIRDPRVTARDGGMPWAPCPRRCYLGVRLEIDDRDQIGTGGHPARTPRWAPVTISG